MTYLLLSLILASSPLSTCPTEDTQCMDAEIQSILRQMQTNTAIKHRDLPQCPMWVESTLDVECV